MPSFRAVSLVSSLALIFSTVFAAANRWGGTAEVEVYEFNQHEGGQGVQWQRQAAWLADVLAG